VLGEMRELGELSESAHDEIGQLLGRLPVAELIAFGGDARYFVARPPAQGQRFVEGTLEALEAAMSLRQPNDVVLVKASRGLRAERIVAALCEEQGALE